MLTRSRLPLAGGLSLALMLTLPVAAQRPASVDQFLSAPFPTALMAARKADRIAWIANEQGRRNVWTAVSPALTPVRVTSFMDDDGAEISDLKISDDGAVVVFVRGSAPNRDGWVPNPTSQADGADRSIWAARTTFPPSSAKAPAAWRVAAGSSPELSPDGSHVLFVRNGQIFRAKLLTPRTPAERGEEPVVRAFGTNGAPRWSPDGFKIAFVSSRVDHSFIGVFDVRTRAVRYLSPSVDRDTSPVWSSDSRRVAFLRKPGLAFGQQAQAPGAGVGQPAGPAYSANASAGSPGVVMPPPAPPVPAPAATPAATQTPAPGAKPAATTPAGRGRATQPPAPAAGKSSTGRGQQAPAAASGRGAATTSAQGRGAQPPAQAGLGVTPPPAAVAAAAARATDMPGLMRGTLAGGATVSLLVADLTSGEVKEAWRNTPDDQTFGSITSIRLAGAHLVFSASVPGDEWDRYFSVAIDGSTPKPVLLTSTNGLIEDASSVSFSPDGRTLYYATNADDLERRHIWSVPVAGGTPKALTSGEGIETSPVALSSGTRVAALTADARRTQSITLLGSAGGPQLVVYPILARTFPTFSHVVPQSVSLVAPDGVKFSNQLFLPADIGTSRRPAIVFAHGGPARQMLLGYHYRHADHVAYGANQWLANQGYVVLSVNYRGSIGYGRTFRDAPNTGGRGNAEYQDVLAAAKYLQTRSDVDPSRIAIWGLSHGGVLTAQALARNSDIFAAGADLAGVHLWGSSLDPDDLAFQSSAIAAIDKWKSPVLLVHADDDRSVAFQQTTGLVQLLRARNVPHELVVFPDDAHESLLHARWLQTMTKIGQFFEKHLRHSIN